MSEKSLLIVASLAYDGIETKENKVDNILGGAGTYICLSLKHFSSEYSIISVVGNDFKSQDLNLLQSCGVDISGIKIEENDKTFYWSCIYTDNFKERITTKTELNVMANFNPVIPYEKSKPDILLLGNLHPEIQLSAINQLNNKPSAIILDTMNYIKPKISTICMGQAASMAAILLSMGTNGKRMALENSRVMIHQPLGGAQGQASDIEIHTKEILFLRDKLNKILSNNTGQSINKIESDTNRDHFMSAEKALDYGIIDKIIKPQK